MSSAGATVKAPDGRVILHAHAYPGAVVAHVLRTLELDGWKGYLISDSGRRLLLDTPVADGFTCTFIQTEPADNEWIRRHKKLRSAPEVAQSLSEMRQHLGTDDPIYNLGRTSALTTPLVLVSKAFGCYARLFRCHSPSTRDWEFVKDMMDGMSAYYDDERARQHAFTLLLENYINFSCPGMCFRFKEARPGESEPDILVEAYVAEEWLLIAIVEVKPESGFNGDPRVELAKYYADATVEKRRMRHWSFERSCCPVLALELVGPLLRVGGLAHFTDKPAHEPFTPFLHMLKYLQDEDHLQLLSRALAAIPATISSLVQSYVTLSGLQVQHGPRRDPSIDFPYFITDARAPVVIRFVRESNSLQTREQQLVFYTRNAAGERKIVKFCQRYGLQVHQQWAEDGYAPRFQHQGLDGGWLVISMDYYAAEDGWRPVTELDPREMVAGHGNAVEEANKYRLAPSDWEECKMAVKNAYQVLHSRYPLWVHGDLRRQNIFYNVKTSQVAFIDFDWAGVHGKERYPLWINPLLQWPPRVKAGGIILAEHDQQLLDIEL
ncbi:uncharacterized protein LOC9640805 [Selaginella moellendorffii]|uniref:uncharacterized protein LOC9640805 n=1 Tax=Selaginella moellendorffii TaxID=88036 RepID=UPI000D1C9B31|nr:uncharacterized protein LOC9640805 [Selaginella moellendorffii]|eukprot:XP_024522739.1 uncharacterized protein LOC9640805 [Selaginella moellendorffii]